MKKAYLDIELDGMSGQIVFPVEGRKAMFFSKMQGINLLVEYFMSDKISKTDFYDFFDRVSNYKEMPVLNRHSEHVLFVSENSGAQRGCIEIEGFRTSFFTSAREGKKLLDYFVRHDIISKDEERRISNEIDDYFSYVIEIDF